MSRSKKGGHQQTGKNLKLTIPGRTEDYHPIEILLKNP